MSEAIEITSIGQSHGRLTGPIFLRAVDQLHSLEFHSARSKDWPVNRNAPLAPALRARYGRVTRGIAFRKNWTVPSARVCDMVRVRKNLPMCILFISWRPALDSNVLLSGY